MRLRFYLLGAAWVAVGCAVASAALSAAVFPSAQEGSSTQQAPLIPRNVQLPDGSVAERVAYRPGDICVACNHAVGTSDPVYQVHGQRLPLHQNEMAPDLAAQLSHLLMLVQPRGAFLGAGRQAAISTVWFWTGLYILVGLVFGAQCAHRALHTGHSPWRWFFAGLAANLLAYLVLRMKPAREVAAPAGIPHGLGKIAATYSPEPCPVCGALSKSNSR